MANLTSYQKPEQQKFESDKLAEMLFVRLKDIFPAFRTSLVNLEMERGTVKQWALGLAENDCLNVDSIQRGLKQARLHDSPFLPSVGMFIKWCKPTEADLGLPTEQEALRQALNTHGTKHKAVLYALSMVDSHALRNATTGDCERIWAKAWKDTVIHVANGGELPEPVAKEMRIERKLMDRDEAIKRSRELVEMFGVNKDD